MTARQMADSLPPPLYPRNASFRGFAVVTAALALLVFAAMWWFR